MLLFPNAKINIGLSVLSKRPDGFHAIETFMYPIPLCDIITINSSKNNDNKGKVTFSCTGFKIDGEPKENLILKAYNLLNLDFNLPPTEIHLHKSIPFGAGLGGGSADCAFTLSALNQLYQLKLSDSKLETYASRLGSDCPFFIKNKPAMAKGRGELIEPKPFSLSSYYLAIVIPPIPISTKEAYDKVVPGEPEYRIEDFLNHSLEKWKNCIVNDFETSVFAHQPEIKKIKELLYVSGAIYASLSGSGSASFGIYRNVPVLRNLFPKDYFIWYSKLL